MANRPRLSRPVLMMLLVSGFVLVYFLLGFVHDEDRSCPTRAFFIVIALPLLEIVIFMIDRKNNS